jgi:glycosyltransferase involved in cell wall biosynthesis
MSAGAGLPITLYIPCYNAGRFLDRVLPAVRRQTCPIAEILVVDDGSTDETAAIARRHGVRVARHETNRGIGAARNTGVREARTDFVACLDADVVPRPDWLEVLGSNLAAGRFDGACGNLLETVDRTLADRWRRLHMQQGWGDERDENPDFLFGNNGLYRRQALLDAGLYDESCRTNGEDVTLCANLKRNAARLVYDPRAVCEHLREDTMRSICRTYWNYHFFDQDGAGNGFLRHTRKRARHVLLKGFRREDLAAGRYRLACLDTFMYWEWRLRAWRLRLRAGR